MWLLFPFTTRESSPLHRTVPFRGSFTDRAVRGVRALSGPSVPYQPTLAMGWKRNQNICQTKRLTLTTVSYIKCAVPYGSRSFAGSSSVARNGKSAVDSLSTLLFERVWWANASRVLRAQTFRALETHGIVCFLCVCAWWETIKRKVRKLFSVLGWFLGWVFGEDIPSFWEELWWW